MTKRAVVAFVAVLLLPVAVNVVLAGAAQADGSSDNGGCYSVLFLDDANVVGAKPEDAIAVTEQWALDFPTDADRVHPLEQDRMDSVAEAAGRASLKWSDASSAIYEARTAGSLDARFELEARTDGWALVTVTVKAPEGFCTSG